MMMIWRRRERMNTSAVDPNVEWIKSTSDEIDKNGNKYTYGRPEVRAIFFVFRSRI